MRFSEESTIPTNPRTARPVGYAFVDVKSTEEANRAIEHLNGKSILERKVSVQLARRPDEQVDGGEQMNGSHRRRHSGRGRGRGRGRVGRGGRGDRFRGAGEENGIEEATSVPAQATPLADATNSEVPGNNEAVEKDGTLEKKLRGPFRQRNRGPPEDGVPSKTKVMVANLPYDMQEEKVGHP